MWSMGFNLCINLSAGVKRFSWACRQARTCWSSRTAWSEGTAWKTWTRWVTAGTSLIYHLPNTPTTPCNSNHIIWMLTMVCSVRPNGSAGRHRKPRSSRRMQLFTGSNQRATVEQRPVGQCPTLFTLFSMKCCIKESNVFYTNKHLSVSFSRFISQMGKGRWGGCGGRTWWCCGQTDRLCTSTLNPSGSTYW